MKLTTYRRRRHWGCTCNPAKHERVAIALLLALIEALRRWLG
jgi:hypothetical protein